jgi:hypothetical protein
LRKGDIGFAAPQLNIDTRIDTQRHGVPAHGVNRVVIPPSRLSRWSRVTSLAGDRQVGRC